MPAETLGRLRNGPVGAGEDLANAQRNNPADSLAMPEDRGSDGKPAKAVVTLADVLAELRRIRQALVATQALAVGERDLARLLGISTVTLHRWKSAGKLIQGIKKGGRILYSMEEVRRWVAASMPDRKVWEAMRRGEIH